MSSHPRADPLKVRLKKEIKMEMRKMGGRVEGWFKIGTGRISARLPSSASIWPARRFFPPLVAVLNTDRKEGREKCPSLGLPLKFGWKETRRGWKVEKAKRSCYRPVLYVTRVLHAPSAPSRGRASEKGSFPVPIERRKNFHAVTISFRSLP